jgi:hypothetical protein
MAAERCEVCNSPTSITETDVDAGTEKGWCLDHAPERYAEDAERSRAVNEFVARWEAWLEERKAAGKSIPSWRVAAASAFNAGISFAQKRGES